MTRNRKIRWLSILAAFIGYGTAYAGTTVYGTTDFPQQGGLGSWGESIEVVMWFSPIEDGAVTQVRFYYPPQPSPPVEAILRVYDATTCNQNTPAILGESAAFTPTSGAWNTIVFPTPVPVTAGNTYYIWPGADWVVAYADVNAPDYGSVYTDIMFDCGELWGDFAGEVYVDEGENTANVQVTKIFSDGNGAEVDVTLTCNSGLPLEQTFTIAGGDPKGVTFVVHDIPEGGADCEVTETGGPTGYTPSMHGGGVGDACDNCVNDCAWEGVTGGLFTCEITNQANPATFTVNKEWVIENGSASDIVESAQVLVFCNNRIDGGSVNGNEWVYTDWLNGNDSLEVTVDTTQQSAECYAVEDINQQTGIESDDDCGSRTISAGGSSSCTITNTVFFEGIPTLSQWGLAILAMLTLGAGLVSYRRFV